MPTGKLIEKPPNTFLLGMDIAKANLIVISIYLFLLSKLSQCVWRLFVIQIFNCQQYGTPENGKLEKNWISSNNFALLYITSIGLY